MVAFSLVSSRCVCDDLCQAGAQYSLAEYDGARAEIGSVVAAAPHVDPANLVSKLFLDLTFILLCISLILIDVQLNISSFLIFLFD